AVTLAYLSDYGFALWGVPEYLQHSWSLSVEEHFYLVWPLLLPAILRLKRPARAVLALYLAAAAWRAFAFVHDGWLAAYYRFDVRFAGILIGCWLALWLRERDGAARGAALPFSPLFPGAALVLAMLFARWGSQDAYLAAMPLAELSAAALILAVTRPSVQAGGWLAKTLSAAPLTALGRLSYGVYLWHYPIALVTRETMPLLPSLVVCATVSVALAWLSWNSVEAVGRRWRERFDARAAVPADQGLVAIRH
ncbi:MAG: acyltransferase, partial [Novosphingobium sp.]|nr:acyltransferase [Novosphingobium sp.]